MWLYDFTTSKDRRLTAYEGTDRLPMWIGDAIYFASDRDGELNIWSYQLADSSMTRITDHTDYDIRRPSHGGDRIVYEIAGTLWNLDISSGETRPIHSRLMVDEASGGRIGYIHLPDTRVRSAIEFPKYYYAQSRKQGLLIDGRFNGGGLDPDIFLQRLAKKPLSYWTRRYSEDHVTPIYVSHAHMALVINRQSGSGGDELALEFRQKGMGPVIGTRTWGGLVGVSMSIDLVDGTRLGVPDYRIYSLEGEWVVENRGVSPDIEVELDPADMARGHDAQLQKGIEVILERIEADPPTPPTHPPFPKRD